MMLVLSTVTMEPSNVRKKRESSNVKKVQSHVMLVLHNVEQDLGIVLMCCFLSSHFKILPYEFFLIKWKCVFKLSSHMIES